jgi:transposase
MRLPTISASTTTGSPNSAGKAPYNRHRRWSLDGTWAKILDGLRTGCDEAEGRDWTISADSTVIRARQHAAGARRARPAELVTGGITE